MSIFLLLNSLVAGGGLFVVTLLAIRSHRLRAIDSTASADYAWAAVPWLFFVLCAAPFVHRVFSGG